MKPGTEITYLRHGRQLRATGTLLSSYPQGAKKVKPVRAGWGAIMVTAEEIEAGSQKGPPIARKATQEPSERKKRERVPKPPPEPHWRWLVKLVRQRKSEGESWITMDIAGELADELEAMATMFSQTPTKSKITPAKP